MSAPGAQPGASESRPAGQAHAGPPSADRRQDGGSAVGRTAAGPDVGREDAATAVEQSIHAALAGLDGLDDLAVGEHVQRFDAVHTALTEALTSAENMVSGASGNGG